MRKTFTFLLLRSFVCLQDAIKWVDDTDTSLSNIFERGLSLDVDMQKEKG